MGNLTEFHVREEPECSAAGSAFDKANHVNPELHVLLRRPRIRVHEEGEEDSGVDADMAKITNGMNQPRAAMGDGRVTYKCPLDPDKTKLNERSEGGTKAQNLHSA